MKQQFSDIGQQAEQDSDSYDCFSLLPRESFQASLKRWRTQIKPCSFLKLRRQLRIQRGQQARILRLPERDKASQTERSTGSFSSVFSSTHQQTHVRKLLTSGEKTTQKGAGRTIPKVYTRLRIVHFPNSHNRETL